MRSRLFSLIITTVALVDSITALWQPPLQSTTVPPLLDVPTYSMATLNEDGRTTNMNILTYATPVSVTPDRIWSLGLYKETLSWHNFCRTRTCILQLLTHKHTGLVKVLGGSSGRDVNKAQECAILDLAWQEAPFSSSLQLLPHCGYYLKLTAVGDLVDAGSHMVAICRVEEMYKSDDSQHSNEPYLSTGTLRELGIITEQGRVATE